MVTPNRRNSDKSQIFIKFYGDEIHSKRFMEKAAYKETIQIF